MQANAITSRVITTRRDCQILKKSRQSISLSVFTKNVTLILGKNVLRHRDSSHLPLNKRRIKSASHGSRGKSTISVSIPRSEHERPALFRLLLIITDAILLRPYTLQPPYTRLPTFVNQPFPSQKFTKVDDFLTWTLLKRHYQDLMNQNSY